MESGTQLNNCFPKAMETPDLRVDSLNSLKSLSWVCLCRKALCPEIYERRNKGLSPDVVVIVSITLAREVV